jgi:hypothetical protein
MDHVDYRYTTGMTDEEVDERLREGTTAVLSLARGGDAYAVPVAYHYDGEHIYLRLTDDGHSTKMAFVEATDRATVLFHEVSEAGSWSILAEGTLRRLEGEEAEAFDATAINDAFDDLRIFDEAIDEVEIAIYELEPAALTGRRTTDGG